jgi:hypothetical protein
VCMPHCSSITIVTCGNAPLRTASTSTSHPHSTSHAPHHTRTRTTAALRIRSIAHPHLHAPPSCIHSAHHIAPHCLHLPHPHRTRRIYLLSVIRGIALKQRNASQPHAPHRASASSALPSAIARIPINHAWNRYQRVKCAICPSHHASRHRRIASHPSYRPSYRRACRVAVRLVWFGFRWGSAIAVGFADL